MDRNDYKSAMQRLAPSEQWRADTLIKMQAAQMGSSAAAPPVAPPAAQTNDTLCQGAPATQTVAPTAASREQQVSARRTAHFPARRTALIAAAAVALIAVPSLYLVLGGAGLHTSDKAAAPAEALSEAATGAAFSSNIALDGAAPEAAPREPAASLQGEDHPAGAAPGAAPGAALGAVPGDSKQESGSSDEPRLAQDEASQTVTGVCSALTNSALTLQSDGVECSYALSAATEWPDGRALRGKTLTLTLARSAGKSDAVEVLCVALA
ncbi:MAG: hypothetical protein RR215_05840 [Ruthenibacterium sp.]